MSPKHFAALATLAVAPLFSLNSFQDDESAWKAAIDRGTQLFQQGDPESGIAAVRDAVRIAEGFGPEDERLVQSLLSLSSLLLQTGEMEESRTHAERAHVISEGVLEAALSRVATSLKFLGNLNMLSGRIEEAEADFIRAVELSEMAVGPDDPETAKHVGNLAAIVLQKGDFDAARALLERALEIWAETENPHPVYAVNTMANLAHLHSERGEHETALKLFADGLAIQEKSWGENSPRSRNHMRKYASALRAAGRDAEAAEMERRVAELGG